MNKNRAIKLLAMLLVFFLVLTIADIAYLIYYTSYNLQTPGSVASTVEEEVEKPIVVKPVVETPNDDVTVVVPVEEKPEVVIAPVEVVEETKTEPVAVVEEPQQEVVEPEAITREPITVIPDIIEVEPEEEAEVVIAPEPVVENPEGVEVISPESEAVVEETKPEPVSEEIEPVVDIYDFNILRDIPLFGEYVHVDAISDSATFTFPEFVSQDNMCDGLVMLMSSCPEECALFEFSLDSDSIAVDSVQKYTEGEVNAYLDAVIAFFEANLYRFFPVEEEVVSVPSIDNLQLSVDAALEEEFVFVEEDDDDFWADFYIAGEDELSFEDGIYYMDLYVNKEYKGNIAVLMKEELPYLFTSEIRTLISSDLTEDANNRIFALQSEELALEIFPSLGVEYTFDRDNYKIYLEFDSNDMPLMVISISSPYRSSVSRPISDSITLEPAVFVLKSGYSFNFGWNVRSLQNFYWSLSMSSNNTLSLYDTYLNFSYNLSYANKRFGYSFGSWNLYHDFTSKMLRLSVGNVSSGLLSPNGTAVGISLTKSTSYGDGSYVKKSPYNAIFTLDKTSFVEVYNGESKIYSRTLAAGNYRMEDFVLYTGANKIKIKVSPVDGSDSYEQEYSFSYYSSLLYPGEFFYTLNLSTGRETLSSANYRDGSFCFKLGSKYLQYDYRNVAASFSFTYGITHSLMLSSGFAFSNNPNATYLFNPKAKANFELTQASRFGTTRYNLNLTESRSSDGSFYIPQIYAHVGHQTSFKNKYLSSLNLNASYNSPSDYKISTRHTIQTGLSFSGRLGILGYSLGNTLSFYTDKISQSPYSVYLSLSVNPYSKMSISSSLNFNGRYDGYSSMTWSVYATLSFKGGSVSAQTSPYSSRVSSNVSLTNNNLSASVNMPGMKKIEDFASASNYNANFNWSSSTDYFGFGMGVHSTLDGKNINGNASLSIQTIFADGYFALSRYIPSSVFLIRQGGILRGNDVSFGYSGSSKFVTGQSFMGTTLYNGVSSTRNTDLMIYSTSNDGLSSPAIFSFHIPASKGRAYKYKLVTDPIYSVAAVAYADDEPWLNGSSPLYNVNITDNVVELAVNDEQYIFTDENGMFILSDLSSGTYAFDIPTKGGWTLAIIEVDEECSYSLINMFDSAEKDTSLILPNEYVDAIYYKYTTSITSDEFWATLYPEEEAL